MKTANLVKQPTGALKFISSLMGRMDQALAKIFHKEAAIDPSFRRTKPFHKLPGYVERKRESAGARRKQAATAAKVANMALVAPKFPKARTHTPLEYRQAKEGGSFTWTGRNTPLFNSLGNRIVGWLPGRRIWTGGISTHKEVTPQ